MLIPDIVENPVIQHKEGKTARYSKISLLTRILPVIHNIGVLTKVKWYVRIHMSKTKDGENDILSGFNPNSPLVTDDIALDYLAELLVDIYLDELENASQSSKHE